MPPGTHYCDEPLFKFNRSLLSALCVCGKEALLKYLKATTEKDITPGIIAVIQSFGSRINFHPHLHFLVTEGGTDKKEQFHKVSQFNGPLLCRFFIREVFLLLLHKQLRKKGADPLCPLIIEDEDPFTPSKGWAEMIKKVYESDTFSFLGFLVDRTCFLCVSLMVKLL